VRRAATTPDLVIPVEPVPFPESVTITGTGLEPTIRFAVPGDFQPDGIRINIHDKNDRLPGGLANVIHTVALLGSARSFTVPPVLSSGRTLQPDGSYALNVQLIEPRGHVPFTNLQSQILAPVELVLLVHPMQRRGL
jgi:hypothetical protein